MDIVYCDFCGMICKGLSNEEDNYFDRENREYGFRLDKMIHCHPVVLGDARINGVDICATCYKQIYVLLRQWVDKRKHETRPLTQLGKV